MIRTATAPPAGTKHRLKEIRELSIIAGGRPIRTSTVREAAAKAATLLAVLLPLSLELIRMFPILPVLVVFLTLFRIAKHLVRLIDLLKLTMSVGIVRIQVRVILPSQLLIGFLDIILRSVLVHPQNFVIIDIGHNLICLVYFSHIII